MSLTPLVQVMASVPDLSPACYAITRMSKPFDWVTSSAHLSFKPKAIGKVCRLGQTSKRSSNRRSTSNVNPKKKEGLQHALRRGRRPSFFLFPDLFQIEYRDL